ncbi:MAG: nucleoid-associated protein, partial [Pricia sp.]
MINLYSTQIETISLHRVGNKNKAEGFFLSEEPHRLNDETTGLLKEYFFKPFRE